MTYDLPYGSTDETNARSTERKPAQRAAQSGLKVLPLSRVAASVAPSMLIAPYLPAGALSILEGDPGGAKTFLAATLAAAVSSGQRLPFEEGAVRAPSPVLYLNAEDSPQTIRERALAAGADEHLFAVLADRAPPSLQNVADYRRIIVRHRPALMVLDPLQAFLGSTNPNSFVKVRQLLTPFVALAEELNLAVLMVRHLSKPRGGARTMHRGLGSIDFFAVARSVMRIGRSPREDESRVLVHLKSSLGVPGTSQEYTVEKGRIRWLGKSELTITDLECNPAKREPSKSALDIAREFLGGVLQRGPKPAEGVMHDARTKGIAIRTLRRAKQQLGVTSTRIQRRGEEDHWEWRLGGHVAASAEEHVSPADAWRPPDGHQGPASPDWPSEWGKNEEESAGPECGE